MTVHEETRLSGERVFQGAIISVEHDQVRLEDGSTALRETVRHPGAVAVLAKDGDRLLLVRQYRYAAGREFLEIPAGKLEPGEQPMPAARRELQEETGCECGQMVPLGLYYGSPGILDEKIWLYFAEITQKGSQHLDEDEFLSVEKWTPAELEGRIAGGMITDGKTLSAFLLARSRGLI